MITRRRPLFALPLVLLAAAAPRMSPLVFVRALYARYPLKDGEASIAFDRRLARWFTEPLLGALTSDRAAATAAGGIGIEWDPLCDCQDDDGFRLETVRVDAQTADTARVKVRFWLPGVRAVNEGAVSLSLRFVSMSRGKQPSLAHVLDERLRPYFEMPVWERCPSGSKGRALAAGGLEGAHSRKIVSSASP